jgi:type VI secretion system protein ImpG
MTDELLPFYQRELHFFRKMGSQFAEAHPKIAARLRLGADGSQDPHVERLIEAFAFLNARTRLKLEDDFPELAEAVLNVLYPHYLAPIPSMSIVRFRLDPDVAADMTDGHLLPAESLLESDPLNGYPCRFKTCYPTRLWPFSVREAKFARHPYKLPQSPSSDEAHGILHLEMQTDSDDVPFRSLSMKQLRLYLAGEPEEAFPLFESIHNETLEVVIASDDWEHPAVLPSDAIEMVGFGRDEGMLPDNPRAFSGYRLLTEFFTLPEKFLFLQLNLDRVPPHLRESWGRTLHVFLLFREPSSTILKDAQRQLERTVDSTTFRLGCTPIINLFPLQAEPIRVTQRESEYRVVPDDRHPQALEIYSIEQVKASHPGGGTKEYQPFFSTRHHQEAATQTTFWQATREFSDQSATSIDRGTEMYLRFVDLNSSPATDTGATTIDVDTVCLNRDLPGQMPFGGGQPRLQLDGQPQVSEIECLKAPTNTWRPALRHGVVWRLASQLTLNHLVLVSDDNGADALREILSLYNFADSEAINRMINGVLRVDTQPQVARVGRGARSSFCRGTEVQIHLDEDRFTGQGAFLLAAVLERFLGLFASINSFTQLVLTSQQRDGVIRRWSPRAGEKTLL